MTMKNNLKKLGLFLFIAVVLYGILFTLIQTEVLNAYYEQILVTIGINIILALSLNLITGFTGQLALGHAGFMCIGAYTSAILTMNMKFPFLVAVVLGGVITAVIGAIIAMPILRLRGDYLAITTLGFGEIIRVIVVNIDYVGGARGLSGIPKETSFTTIFIFVVITILVVKNIINSKHGRAMISIREDEIAAEAMGINTTKYKFLAFAISALIAGIAGGLYAHYFSFIDPKSFGFMKSVEIVTFVVLGGMGSITGSVISATVLTYLPELLRDLADYRMIIYSVLLIVIMLFRPQGLMGSKELSFKVFGRKKNKIEKEEGKA